MQLRELPSVDTLLVRLRAAFPHYPHALLRLETRRAIATARKDLRDGKAPEDPESRAAEALRSLAKPSLAPVINATGVVLHTNLGRAPLGPVEAFSGYSNLEYDLKQGRRGNRDGHCAGLLECLLGAPAIAVNNNAAAVYLALHELAEGGETIVSRGELIEIGDGFRIPEIIRRSGVRLVEVGTTNRTRTEDYRDAITERTRLLLRVHPSNFHMSGFTARPPLEELVALGKQRGIPVYEDLGSGCLVDLRAYGIDEPLVKDSLRLGVDVVSFSGDKLLGGPQAGYLAGRGDLVQRMRRNPMFRALRVDKLVLQAAEATLRRLLFEDLDAIPALAMIRQTPEAIRARAERLAEAIPGANVIPGESVIGGGSTPDCSLPTYLIALSGSAHVLEDKLRRGDPPVIARVAEGLLVIDLRTVSLTEEPALLRAILEAV